MKISLTPDLMLAGGALLGLAYVAINAGKIADKLTAGATSAAQAINPVNRENIFASGVNAVGGALVSDPDGPGKNADGSWTLGAWLYDVTHDMNNDNIFASGVNSIGGAIVSDPVGPGKNADGSWSLGAWIYDVTHDNPLTGNTGGVTGSW